VKRKRHNPLRPEAHADDPAPTALAGPTGLPRPDDRRGVHLTTNFDRAVWYAMTKACNTRVRGLTNNTGIVFEFDVKGLDPQPDFDAEVERSHSGLGDSAYIVAREFELEPGNRRDRERLRNWLEREAEQFGDFEDRDTGSPLTTIAEASGAGRFTNIFAALAELAAVDDGKADEIIEELHKHYLDKKHQLPLYWFAHAVQQWRFFEPIDDDRLVESTVIKPFVDEWYNDYEDIPQPGPGESNDDVLDGFTIDDADNLQLTTLVVWKRAGKPRPRETMFHGTDLWRARQIFPRLAKYFESPWPFMMASENCHAKVVDDSKNPTSMLQLALPGVI
jgi:hypothetical protein